jgi:DNA-binding GntR family transcriptional regulator
MGVAMRAATREDESATTSLVEESYRALKDAIRRNQLLPGYQASEQEIADQLGVSRTPVHEAVIRLQQEGLVQVLPRRGVRICPISPGDIREIYDVVIALEAMAAELLAAMPAKQRAPVLTELGDHTTEMERALRADDLDRWAAADDAFHAALIAGCGNSRIARLGTTMSDQLHRARIATLRMRPKPKRSAVEHRAILAAIRSSDPEAAHASARAHRVRSRDELLPLLAKHGLLHL